jgi:hypothetical protein
MKKLMICLTTIIILLFTTTSSPYSQVTPTDLLVYQIGWYESRNNHNVKPGDNGKSFGRWQFQQRTFDWMKKLSGKHGLNIMSEKDQEELLRWALENNLGTHWTGYRIVMGGIKMIRKPKPC